MPFVQQRPTLQKDLLNIAVTDANLRQIKPFISSDTGFTARVAVLVSMQFSGHIASVFAQIQAQRQHKGNIQYCLFTERDEALNWLISTDSPT